MPTDATGMLAAMSAPYPLIWRLVDNTAGFGNLADGQHIFWTGDFTGAGHDQVLFYYNGDHNWWLGAMVAVELTFIELYNSGSGTVEVHWDALEGSSYKRTADLTSDFSPADTENGTWQLLAENQEP